MQNHFGELRTRARDCFACLAPAFFRLFVFFLLFEIVLSQGQVLSVRAQSGEQLILTKTVEGGVTTAQVGDVIRYRIRFECSSLTGPCGQMEITDVLPPGLIYQPPPASSVPAGFTISYNSGTRTITITKDDNNLLDGSQYDAVIAVQVDYDLRPLPATVTNTVGGRIYPPGATAWVNATPSSAPPITVGTASPHWAVTKSLFSPTVNPTVNTNVTYRIQLCPTTPPSGQGNAPLQNITLTDTLPAGATFVSASDGGTESGGVVTWPVYAGPLDPPNCLTRYVTIRYDSADFTVGDTVTNTAHADADYTPSSGTCTSPCIGITGDIDHPIGTIAQVPSYSKNDVGDPVGFTGTGRFILNLNTDGTNYPSNDLILIDNLPPQFQVTEVTSGQWSAAFEHVRAFVEYSTNNGSTYTAFPGQPISYNTDAAYTAPATNITNVRWRFEYDPDGTAPFTYTQAGLPYTWSFTESPEIRVTPRATATIADPPSGAPMPAAIAGDTYNNCLQVSRTDNLGNPVTDPCNIEPMTVQGTFVSLQVYKDETPGEGWDDVGDPNIDTFTPDGSILPGDTLRYTLTVEITERSSTDLVNPTIQDTLPVDTDFIFVRNGTARLDGVALPGAQQPTFTQAGRVLTWAWNDPSPALTINPPALGSRYLTVEFFGYVPRGQSPGTYTNDLYAVTDSEDVLCEIGTTEEDSTSGNVDGDIDTTDPACRNPDSYIVERSAALRGEKWIRSISPDNAEVVNLSFLPDGTCPNGGTDGLTSIPTNPFTRYPCISQAFPEGALSPGQLVPPPTNPALDDFEYNLRIFNDGNVPMLHYVLYDILPYVGDTGSGGTLSNQPRQSQFRPILRGPVEFISGPGLVDTDFTIEYNNTTNPCRPEVFNQPMGNPVPAGCNNTWTLAAAVTDWTQVRSYRIRLNEAPGTEILPAATSSEVRFGVPMYIPADAPPTGFDANDALSHEIAWNSYSHVGSYDKDPDVPVVIQDLLASEPRKVGITVPEVMSVGNRVWRDSDNSGLIDAPDDTNPGIAGVTVNLYRDVNNDGIADGPVGSPTVIATTLTDIGGYYLFSNIPFDSGNMNNNRYIIGIPATNFSAGQPLYQLRSSTGTPATAMYITPTSNTVDSADDGIDPATPGLAVFSWPFTLEPTTEPTSEADLSANDRDGLPGARRGVNGERDNNSDLTIDFGFFGGTDIPFSIGNHVWYDNGNGGGVINDGIRQANEPLVAGVRVQLYRDGNANGRPEVNEMIRWDNTDANGFYLFDNLDPGPYFVQIAPANFAAAAPLAGWYSSQPTGTETLGVNGGATTADIDNDDNGVNADFPEIDGVFSGVVVLTRGVPEPTGETYLSGEADPGPPANDDFNPTGWDGPLSRGRFGEADNTSNLTIDFGFIPPMSLGNRVWIDEGAGTTPFRAGYNNGIQDGTEAGAANVRVELWRDTNGNGTVDAATDTFLYFTTTDATGYYLFERLQPGNDYLVHIPASNFSAGGPLQNYLSSTDMAPPLDDAVDRNDNGIDNPAPGTNGITSPSITMSYNSEPLTPANETDINTSGTYGPNNVGNFGQEDNDSNLTMDFGFVRPLRSLGNRVWYDPNNDGQINAGDDFDTGTAGDQPGIPGIRVSLYQDSDGNGQPDDINTLGNSTDDWLGWDTTDATGYYLFDDLPPGRYVVGVDYTNFAGGGPLDGYNSSRGYVDNLSNDTDSRDNGVDRLQMGNPALSPYGVLSTSIDLTVNPLDAPTGETGSGDTSMALGFNPTAGDGPNSRGRFGETDDNSDLTIDFGFFIPMSLGNRVFRDDGTGGGVYNNGIMDDGGEPPIAGVRVELWRDADADGVPDAGGLVGFDTTDAGGYYLFDDLAPGSYVVVIPSSNFTGGGPLVGYNTSTPTGTENVGVPLNPYTPNTDRDDNGLNVGTAPTTDGVRSGTVTLALTTEAAGETELSGEAMPGSGALNFDPTGWDGPLSRGRWEERDNNSNLTIDFGFIPVFSLGNRVWFDTNNNSLRNGAEVGVNNVRVQLFASDGVTEIPVGPDGILYTADDALGGMLTAGGGYYRFNNLPAGDYLVRIPASNFGVGQPLRGYWSSATIISNAGVIGETTAPDADITPTDSDDNGTLLGGNVDSAVVTLGPLSTPEPTGEPDLSGGQGQPDAQANMTVDFGFYTITLGNQVWVDVNNNGLLDTGETGINGVTVQLWSQDLSTMFATTTTAGGGVYSFTGLPAGNYIVRLPAANFNSGGPLAGYRSSTGAVLPATYEPAPNPDATTVDSDDNGTETGGPLGAGGYVQTSAFALTPAAEQSVNNGVGRTNELRVDFGVVELVALGNRVWFDTGAGAFYNNGILDAGEIPVDNVTVQLYTSTGVEVPVGPDGILGTADDALGGMVTSGGGYYRFDRLHPGTYYVHIPSMEFQPGGDLFGYVSSTDVPPPADETSDQDVDENGIDVATLTATGIRTQDYTLLPNTERTGEDQSNYAPGTLDDNNVNFTADFGFTQLVAIGNRVWIDDGAGGGTPNDGIQQPGELGVDGVTVELYASPGNTLVATTTTTTVAGQPGSYQFTNLNPGDYYVHIPASMFDATLPSPLQGYVSSTDVTPKNETSDQNADENGLDVAALVTTGISTQVFTLSVGGETIADDETTYTGYLADANVNFTADFGFLAKVAIGNVVWSDNGAGGGTANDGIQNGTEPGIPGVDLQLYRVGDTPGVNVPVQTTSSGANGYYAFDDLLPGDYFIYIPPTEFQAGGTLESYRSSTGNGADETTDQNGDENGIDNTFPAVNGITSTNYTLQPNTERTGEPQPNYTGALDDDNVNFTADFGFTGLVALGNRVWFDTGAGAFYNNGILDAGETPVDNVTVQLYTSAGVEVPVGPDGILGTADDAPGGMVTSGGGYYRFDRLSPGTYYVLIPAAEFQAGGQLFGYESSLGSGANETGDNDADENGIDVATLTTTGIRTQDYTLLPDTEQIGEDQTNYAGALDDDNVNFTADFGFTQMVAIGNRVWFDIGSGGGTPNDGIQNGTEAGAANVDVQLYRVGDTPGVTPPAATTTTDASGNYQFTNLNPGDYFIHIPASEFQTGQPLAGYISSTGNGSNETSDQDADENGIDAASLATNGISSTPYTLLPNSERAGEDQSSYTGILDDDNVNFTADFGFLQFVAIGNRVWLDTGAGAFYNNGILDAGETPVDNVTVELYTSGGAFVATTTTAGGGYYQFDMLYPGQYYVQIPAAEFASGELVGYVSTTVTGADETSDNDADENGIDVATLATTGIRTQVYDLQPNTETTADDQTNYTGYLDDGNVNFTADFSFVRLVALGNRVWFDTGLLGGTPNNGIQDGGELGIGNVDVQLFRVGDTPGVTPPVATDTTDANGDYYFDLLNPGDYFVHIPASEFQAGNTLEGFFSSAGNGANETSDQDADENGIDSAALAANGINSTPYTLTPDAETTADNDAGYAGYLDDDNVNFTADFGFLELVAIGNIVWADSGAGGGAANNGIQDGTEPGIPGVDLQLFHVGDVPGVSAPVAVTTTAANGYYVFDNLLPGDYFIFIPAAEFQGAATLAGYVSSTGNGTDETSDQDADENGIDDATPWTNGITSTSYTLQPNTERTGEAQPNYTGGLGDNDVNFTVDFGFFNNPRVDLGVTKDDGTTYYIAGGTLTYTVTVRNNGPVDVIGLTVSDTRPGQISSWTWACTSSAPNPAPATYGCTPDAANPSPFTDNLDLPVGASVTYTVSATVDPAATGVLTNTVTVTPPAGTVDIVPPNDRADDVDNPASLTVDKDDHIGVVSPGAVITYDILVTNNGAVDLTTITVTDTLPADLTYQSASPAPTSIAGQTLTWSGISLTAGSSTTINVTARVADPPASGVITNSVDVTDTNTSVTATDDDRDTVAGTSDFTKTLIDTNHLPTTDPDVTIGEILTYELVLNVPAGSLDNVRVVDLPQAGLAFVDVISVTVSDPDTDGAGAADTGLYSSVMTFDAGTGTCTNCNDGTTAGVSNPLIENNGARVIFDLGTLTNSTAATETLTIRYSLVVLDISANQSGRSLTNNATWTWTGGNLQATTPPVRVVEPDLTIDKNADVTQAPYGTPITFTLAIGHTIASSSNAYDVVITDVLPTGLGYVPGTLSFSGLAPTSSTYDPVTFTLTFIWDEFPLAQTATVTFQATFVGPAPVTNSANVFWSSLPIDPVGGLPVVQSPYHPNSTERWYDPLDAAGINNYGASDTVRITVPPLPKTGFAPGMVTELPDQPDSYSYTDLGNFWIEVPALNVKLPIVGVPLTDADGWNLTWLGNQAGWLEGTAYPTHPGNSAITAHAINAEGQPGPFADLGKLYWGQKIIVHLDGQKYIYEVRDVRFVWPDDRLVFRHEEYSWLTLITCKDYNKATNSYAQRVVLRAVLISVEEE